MKVRDLMTQNVECCMPETDLSAAAMMMWRNDCGVVPVTSDDGRVLGMITDRDICMAVATRHLHADEIQVKDVISGQVHSVQPNDNIDVALERMRAAKVRRVPVVSQDGQLRGVVSLNDLILNTGSGRDGRSDRLSQEKVMSVLSSISEHANERTEVHA